jgi:hypothetical protein
MIGLQVLAAIAALVFVIMLVATAMHRAAGRSEDTHRTCALAEYLWTMVPWLMMGACVAPAVRRIVAAG